MSAEKEVSGSETVTMEVIKRTIGGEVSMKATDEDETAPPAGSTKGKDNGNLLEESKQRSQDVIAGARSLLVVTVLGLACIVAFSSRLFAVIRFESIIHEFDPW